MWWMVGLAKTLQTCKAESFLKIINGWELLTIDTKVPILDQTSLWALFYKSCNFIKKETQAQVFSCEFCEISTKTFFKEHLRTTASIIRDFWIVQSWQINLVLILFNPFQLSF